MRKLFLFYLLLVFCVGNLLGQGNTFKDIRQTYLWDVTLSMKGYNGAPNIYDKVVNSLINDINSITNERTEIVVIPFQDTKYCDVWRVKATKDAKIDLINRIKRYKNEKITRTNISLPLLYSIDQIFTSDRIDIMKLMTDGLDNVDPSRVEKILSSWCDNAHKKDVYGYYIMLTDAAVDQELIQFIKNICRFEVVHGMQIDEIISLMPPPIHSINVRDEYNKKQVLRFSANDGSKAVPENYKVLVKSEENPYFTIDEEVIMTKDNSVEIELKYKMDKDELTRKLSPDYNENIRLSISPSNGMDVPPYSLTRVLNRECKIRLINKPEKTLRVYVE